MQVIYYICTEPSEKQKDVALHELCFFCNSGEKRTHKQDLSA